VSCRPGRPAAGAYSAITSFTLNDLAGKVKDVMAE
jgi:hypothetical protein